MKRSVWIIIAAVVIVAVVALALAGKRPANQPSNSSAASNSANQSSAATITYDASGFAPAMTTVKSGSAVTFENKSAQAIQVDSNPHPVHTDDTDLNVGPIGPGQSKTVVLTKKGTFGFHNHLSPSDTASVTVQ